MFLITLFIALAWHALLKRMWWANIGSTLTSTIVAIWMLAAHSFGRIDKAFFIILATVLGISFMISVIVGAVFSILRKKVNAKKNMNQIAPVDGRTSR